MPAIVYCRNLPGREADFGNSTDMRVRRSWLIKTDSRTVSEAVILKMGVLAGYLPIPYVSYHPDDPQYLCKRLRGKQEKQSPLHWIIDGEFDNAPTKEEDKETSPLAIPAKISWSSTKYQKAFDKDKDGKPLINAAGDYFDPPPIHDLSRLIATVRKNIANPPSVLLEYMNHTNDATWNIDGISVDAGVAKIAWVTLGEEQFTKDVVYREFSYSVEFDPIDYWRAKPLNIGFFYLQGPGAGIGPANKVRFTDSGGRPMAVPQPLKLDGSKLPEGSAISDYTYMDYRMFDSMDYSILPVT